jgi:predicted DNA-binding transcriptional regulator YafY
MRASRLLSILLRLQTHGRLTADHLAKHFEVSVRTIYRDVDHLSEAGVPVFAERGRAGGFRLLDGFRSELTALTRPEAEALFLTGLPGPAAELGLAGLLSSARVKLLSAVPPGIQAERISDRFHLDPLGWFRSGEKSSLLPEIARATWTDRCLDIAYRSRGKIVHRRIQPLGVVLKGGIWYLIARRERAIRTYKVSAIEEAKVLTRPFKRPGDFVLSSHWARAAREYEANTIHRMATVRLSPTGRRRISMLGDHVAERVAQTAGKPDRAGWVTCTLPIEPGDEGIRELLRFGEDVKLIAPATLKQAIRRRLAELARHHDA